MEWINVDDKLPEYGDSVLVSYNSNFNNHAGIMTGRCYGNNFYSGGSYAITNVTHWIPLPEPPKEQQ